MQGENVCNFILLLCISVNKLFERNERSSFAVYCNCMAERNFYFTKALIVLPLRSCYNIITPKRVTGWRCPSLRHSAKATQLPA